MPIAIEEPINTYPASGQGEPGIAGVTDAPGVPVVTLADAVVLETNSTYSPNMQFVVTLSEAATAEVRIDYRTIGKTATDGGDYDAVSGTLVVAAGQTSAVIAITTYGGSAVEFDESFVLELTNARGAQFADGAVSLRAAGTILDNDGTGAKLALLVGDAEVVEGHSGQREVVFEVRLSQPVDQAVTVNYTTAPGTASSGVDFAPVSGTLTFLAGQTVATVHVPVYGDTAVESTEQFSLVLSAPGGAGAEGVGRILDDDAGGGVVPVISIEPAQVLESNSTYSPTMEFVVRLSAPTTQTVRVSYATVAGTALAGSDYVATSGTLTFAPGQTSAVIVVTPYGGTAVEPDETFVLRLTNPQNAALAGGVAALDAIGTIIDNDAPAAVDGLPILSVADVQVQEAPGGATAVFTLNLSSPTAAAVSGQFAVVAGTASAGADFTPVSGTFLIEPGQSAFTVEVPILDDALDEPTETFVLRLSEISNAGFAGTDTELWAIGEIVDDDVTPGVAVAAGGDLEVAEGQAFGRTVNFTDGADAGANGWTYEIDWDGDGLADETGSLAPGNSSFDISHVYPDGPAATVVTVKVIDEAGMDEASASFTVAVTNVAPVIALTGAGSVDEGSAYMLNFGTLADPGADAATEFAALGGNASHTYADDGNYGITLSVTDEDGSFVAGSKSVTVEGNVLPPETVGVSGQSAATSSVRQEIDGREVLRIELGQAASKVTVDLSRFYLNDDGTLHAESGRLRLLDASGNVVDEATFVADSTTGGKTVSLDSTADFTAVEISAGAYDGTDFVFGAYAGAGGGFATGVYADGAGLHGSDFLVNWVEFEFQPVGTLQPNPLDL